MQSVRSLCPRLLSCTTRVSQLPVTALVCSGFSRRMVAVTFRCFSGMCFLHLQGGDLVQADSDIAAKTKCVHCVRRLRNFRQSELQKEGRKEDEMGRVQHKWEFQGMKRNPEHLLHGAGS